MNIIVRLENANKSVTFKSLGVADRLGSHVVADLTDITSKLSGCSLQLKAKHVEKLVRPFCHGNSILQPTPYLPLFKMRNLDFSEMH